MSEALLEQVKRHRKEIKHEVLTYALSELINMFRADPQEVEIQPEWQRLFRWSREQQSAFVESIVLEIPIPPLFFFETDEGRWELLDGLQRFATVVKFMGTDSDVPVEQQGENNNYASWHYENQNNIKEPLQLLAGEYLTSLAGLSFARLPTALKLNLKRARIQIYVLNTTASGFAVAWFRLNSPMRLVAQRASRQPLRKHARDRQAHSDEAVVEMPLRPRRRACRLPFSLGPRGGNAAHARR